MNTSLPPTLLPADWTAAKDKAHVDACGGDQDLDSLFAEVLRARRKLGDKLNSVLAGFGASVDGSSTPEKLFMLENLVREDTLTDDYLAWVLEGTFYARYAAEQFDRIMALYSSDGTSTWLMPLIELKLHLLTAAELVEERRPSNLPGID